MRRLGAENGSALVESLVVSLLVAFLVLSLMQVAYAMHVRSTMMSIAGEGARRVALVDATPAEGQVRINSLMEETLSGLSKPDVTIKPDINAGERIITVTVRGKLPIIGPWGIPGALTVKASAYAEPQ